MAVNNSIVVSTVKQIGRRLVLIGSNEVSYQLSADLLIELQMDTSSASPFAGLLLEAMAKPPGAEPYYCPIIIDGNKKFIQLSAGVLSTEGTVKLSIGGIDENKLVVTSNTIDLCVDESNGIESKMSPTEKYWQIEVSNAMKYWYETQLKPEYDSMRDKLERAEAGRAGAESTRVSAESTRNSNETMRVSNENLRKNAEGARVSSENSRISSEANRNTAENLRSNAETIRLSNETARVNSETTRGSNETARRNAESNRVTAENNRVNAETNRSASESDRVVAETTRIGNETSRINAETSRGTAETTRSSAEANRISAETNRASAETVRVGAESKRQADTTAAVTRANSAAERCEDVADGNYATQADIQNLQNSKFNSTGGKLEGNLIMSKGSVIKGLKSGLVIPPVISPIQKSSGLIDMSDQEVNMISVSSNGNIYIGDLSSSVTITSKDKVRSSNGLISKNLALEDEVLKLTGGTLTGGVSLSSSASINGLDAQNVAQPTLKFTGDAQGNRLVLGNSVTALNIMSNSVPNCEISGARKALALAPDVLPLTGGTLTGNLTLKNATAYGCKINFGDSDYVHISEPTDDTLELKGSRVNIVNTNDATTLQVANNKVTYLGNELAVKPEIVNLDTRISATLTNHTNTISSNTNSISSLTTRVSGVESVNSTQNTSINNLIRQLTNFLDNSYIVNIAANNFNMGNQSGTSFCIAHKGITTFNGEFVFLTSYSASYSSAITVGTINDAKFRPKQGVMFMDVPIFNVLVANESQYIGHCDITITPAGVITVNSGSLTCAVQSGRWIRMGGRSFPNSSKITDF